MCLRDGEGTRQETKPLELDRRHEEPIGHEAGQPFKVEGRCCRLVVSQFTYCRRLLLLEFLNFDRDEVARSIAGSSIGTLSKCRNSLRDRICYSAQNLNATIQFS